MWCCRTCARMERSKTTNVLGVWRWQRPAGGLPCTVCGKKVMRGWRWSAQLQNAQSLIEYALMLAGAGVLLWALLSTFPQIGSQLVADLLHVLTAGWADWMLTGQF